MDKVKLNTITLQEIVCDIAGWDFEQHAPNPPTPPSYENHYLLLEDTGYLLLEDGSKLTLE